MWPGPVDVGVAGAGGRRRGRSRARGLGSDTDGGHVLSRSGSPTSPKEPVASGRVWPVAGVWSVVEVAGWPGKRPVADGRWSMVDGRWSVAGVVVVAGAVAVADGNRTGGCRGGRWSVCGRVSGRWAEALSRSGSPTPPKEPVAGGRWPVCCFLPPCYRRVYPRRSERTRGRSGCRVPPRVTWVWDAPAPPATTHSGDTSHKLFICYLLPYCGARTAWCSCQAWCSHLYSTG